MIAQLTYGFAVGFIAGMGLGCIVWVVGEAWIRYMISSTKLKKIGGER